VLDYLTDSLRHGWRQGEEELRKFLQSLPAVPKEQSEAILALLRQNVEKQRARLAQFEPLLTGGDPEKGKAVFFSPKAVCSTCHAIGSQGGRIGPDLTKIGTVRSGRDILEAILLPSSTIAQGYENYLVTTKDGRVAGGVIARQSADVVVLRDSSGAEWRLQRGEIETMQRQPTSLMPEGLERQLSADEFRDLLAFLQRLR
jgi:putative heme-binding domain-containing protein